MTSGGSKPATPGLPLWRLSDGRTGHDRQAAALAAELGGGETVLPVAWPIPWRWAAPHLLCGMDRLCRDWPEPAGQTLIIGCGRRAALANRWFKRRYGRRVFTVQILDPRAGRDEFDVLIVPAHDGLSGPNVLPVSGGLHPIDGAWLAAARVAWRATFEALPPPRRLVLIGGGGRRALWRLMAPAVEAARQSGGSVLVSFSRRTPARLAGIARNWLSAVPHFLYTAGEPNPYSGMLAWADRIRVTADSVNMISEALACGVPVEMIGRPPSRRHRRFVNKLCPVGLLGTVAVPGKTPCAPLRETAGVALHIRRLWEATDRPYRL